MDKFPASKGLLPHLKSRNDITPNTQDRVVIQRQTSGLNAVPGTGGAVNRSRYM